MNTDHKGQDLNRSNNFTQEPTLQDYLQVVLRGKWWVLGIFAAVLTATAVFTYLTKPVYEATTSVLIDTKGQQDKALLMFDVMGMSTVKNIKNELEILKSTSLAEKVASGLLERKYVDSAGSEELLIIRGPKDSLAVRPYATVREVTVRLQNVVEFEPVRDADVIKITARSNSASEAALIANAYADSYYDRNLVSSRIRSRSVREFLDEQMKTRQVSLRTAEDSLQNYMKREGIVSVDEESKNIIEQLSQLEAQRDAEDIGIQASAKTLSSYKEELVKVEPNVSQVIGEASDPYIRLLQEQLAQLEVKKDVTVAQNPAISGQTIYTDKLKEIDDQIDALRKKLKSRTTEYLKSLIPGFMPSGGTSATAASPSVYLAGLKARVIELQIEQQSQVVKKKALDDMLAQYEARFQQIPKKSIEYARRERSRLSNEKLYLLVEEKYNEAAIKEKSEFGYVDIIDPAIVPAAPISPKVRLNLLVGVFLGFGFGVGFVFVREYFDVRVRTPEDLKKRGFTALTAVGLMDDEIRKFGGKTEIEKDGRLVDAHLLAFVNPLSSIAESYRRLRTSIQYAQPDKPIQTIMVTSANPAEGKSTTVSNLAITFAQAGKRVVLLDTDLRLPTLHTEFGLDKHPGLVELLYNDVGLPQALRKTPVEGLEIICCGTVPPNPSETLASAKMKDLVDRLKKEYDIILFDSPPVLAVTDPAVLSTLVDGVVLVVSSGHTRADALERSVELLHEVGARLLGFVLNNFNPQQAYGGYYGQYKYHYYSSSYGEGGGEKSKKVNSKQ